MNSTGGVVLCIVCNTPMSRASELCSVCSAVTLQCLIHNSSQWVYYNVLFMHYSGKLVVRQMNSKDDSTVSPGNTLSTTLK